MQIRTFSPPDMESVLDIWLRASREAHAFIPDDYWYSKVGEMRSRYLPASQVDVFCDESTGEVIAFIATVDDYIAALFVDPDRQGQKIGVSLLKFRMERSDNLRLRVYAQNERAIRFYHRYGFRIAGTYSDDQTGESEFEMVWTRSGDSE